MLIFVFSLDFVVLILEGLGCGGSRKAPPHPTLPLFVFFLFFLSFVLFIFATQHYCPAILKCFKTSVGVFIERMCCSFCSAFWG